MDNAKSQVILVDQNDREIGVMEKLEAHHKGLLHRAFSIFLFNSNGEMLLQKRAAEKYHCGGLWSNACCSHPVPDKPIQRCLQEKLQQEMGMNAELEKAFEFTYRAELNNGLIEHEYDHIYLGYTAALPQPNPSEVSEWRYINIEGLEQELKLHPECFTPWFQMLFSPLKAHFEQFHRA